MQLLVRHHVNAVALNDPSALYCEIAQLLTKQTYADGESAFAAIESATSVASKRSKTMYVSLVTGWRVTAWHSHSLAVCSSLSLSGS